MSTTGGGCCCLIAKTFAEEFGRLLKETKDMEEIFQPGVDRVEAHTNASDTREEMRNFNS